MTTSTTAIDATNPNFDVRTAGFTLVPILQTRRIKVFNSADFTLENPDTPLNLRNDDCTILLFYGTNQESIELGQIFAKVANDTPGPAYGSINLDLEDRIVNAFNRIGGDLTHPQHRFALRGYPEIIVWRNRRPVGKYNGAYDTGIFRMFVSTQACTATWNEPVTLAAGVASNDNVTYQRPNSYYDLPGQAPVVKYTSAELTPSDVRRPGGTAGANQSNATSVPVTNNGPRVAPV